MLAHFQVLEIGGFTCPSAVDCIYPRIQHALLWQRNVSFLLICFSWRLMLLLACRVN